MVRYVAESGVTNVNVYLPGGSNELWYDINDYKVYTGNGNLNVPVTLDMVIFIPLSKHSLFTSIFTDSNLLSWR